MTRLLEEAVEVARALPATLQDDIARAMLALAGKDEDVVSMPPEEEASFALSRSQASRGDFASEERMRAIWSDDP